LRYYRTTGLTLTQMQELVRRVNAALEIPWRKRTGRPKALGLYRAVEAVCAYLRQNATQEFIGDMRDASQSTVSRYLAALVPVISSVLQEFVPSAESAAEAVRERGILVDGTIVRCWSYEEHEELWSGKKAATGFNVQVVSLLDGTAVYVSDPLPGKTHDYAAFYETPVAEIVRHSGGGIGDRGYQGTGMVTPRKKPYRGELSMADKECNTEISALRALVEQTIAHLKSWRIFHADYRRPYQTYRDAYDAARGLFFYSAT
jgi:DDE superfamily endonuclease